MATMALPEAPRSSSISPVSWRRVGGRFLASPWPLLLPAALLYGLMGAGPMATVLAMSLREGWGAYARVLVDPLLGPTLENSLVIAFETTACALLLGYVLAAAMWRGGRRRRAIIMLMVMLPFWTGVLVKNFAWAALLQDNGAVNHALAALGLIHHPLRLLHNRFAVVLGMTHYVVPLAVFPIYTAMQTIDPHLDRAARSLGASAASAFWRIIFPLTLPGVYAAGLLVFIVSTGFYLTPVILGSPRDLMVANLVDSYTHETVDFPAAAALSVMLTIILSIVFLFYQRLPREGQHGRL